MTSSTSLVNACITSLSHTLCVSLYRTDSLLAAAAVWLPGADGEWQHCHLSGPPPQPDCLPQQGAAAVSRSGRSAWHVANCFCRAAAGSRSTQAVTSKYLLAGSSAQLQQDASVQCHCMHTQCVR